MISTQTFREMALALPDTIEAPHFDKASFRTNKKLFATLDEKKGIGMLVLPPGEQYVYCKTAPDSFAVVTGHWGKQGCTYVHLKQVKKSLLKEAMQVAYEHKMKNKTKGK